MNVPSPLAIVDGTSASPRGVSHTFTVVYHVVGYARPMKSASTHGTPCAAADLEPDEGMYGRDAQHSSVDIGFGHGDDSVCISYQETKLVKPEAVGQLSGR